MKENKQKKKKKRRCASLEKCIVLQFGQGSNIIDHRIVRAEGEPLFRKTTMGKGK
jgi:hypothetical protein